MKQQSRFRQRMLLLCLILGIILLVLIAGTFLTQGLLAKFHYVDPETTPTLSQEELDSLLPTEVPDPEMPTLSPEQVQLDPATPLPDEDAIHILLIGQDRLPGETRARSDAMILCSFHRAQGCMTMTSFLRDLYVQIPGYRPNRLNAAYAAGGMALLDQTLAENFGITIHGNFEVDFSQFPQIIDLLGGVTLDLRQDEATYLNESLGIALTEGRQHLTGTQALAYARIRKLDAEGDFGRTNRQRKLLTSLIDSLRQIDKEDTLSLLEALFPLLTTDMTGPEIFKTALSLLPMLPDMTIETQAIPAEGTYSHAQIDGMSVLVADLSANRELLAQMP